MNSSDLLFLLQMESKIFFQSQALLDIPEHVDPLKQNKGSAQE